VTRIQNLDDDSSWKVKSLLANATLDGLLPFRNSVASWEEHYQELIDLALLERTYPVDHVLAHCLKMHMNRHEDQGNHRYHQKMAMIDVCENLRWRYYAYPVGGQHLCDLLALLSHHVAPTAP
jgi:hypothetical protein